MRFWTALAGPVLVVALAGCADTPITSGIVGEDTSTPTGTCAILGAPATPR